MSKPASKSSNAGRSNFTAIDADDYDAQAKPKPSFKPPLQRRPGLFYAMLGVFGVWVAVLLTLYCTTVYPHRHDHERTRETTTR